MRECRREDAIRAVREWQTEHGRPPHYREWEKAAPGRPTSRTIERRWGWDVLIAEALNVAVTDVAEKRKTARRQGLLVALAGVREETGFWPTAGEWERAQLRPSRRTLVRAFGSWEAACDAAERDLEAAFAPLRVRYATPSNAPDSLSGPELRREPGHWQDRG